jgi:hypothetical protein
MNIRCYATLFELNIYSRIKTIFAPLIQLKLSNLFSYKLNVYKYNSNSLAIFKR